MKNNFSKKIFAPLATLAGVLLQTSKFTESSTREYALRGRFYYFPEF